MKKKKYYKKRANKKIFDISPENISPKCNFNLILLEIFDSKIHFVRYFFFGGIQKIEGFRKNSEKGGAQESNMK